MQPHIPFKFDRSFLQLYPLDLVPPPKNPSKPAGLPDVAWVTWDDVRSREDVSAVLTQYNVTWPYDPLPEEFSKMIRQHYYAAVSYVDHQIGRLLDALAKACAFLLRAWRG